MLLAMRSAGSNTATRCNDHDPVEEWDHVHDTGSWLKGVFSSIIIIFTDGATYYAANPDLLRWVSNSLGCPVTNAGDDVIKTFLAWDRDSGKRVPFGQRAVRDTRESSGNGACVFVVNPDSLQEVCD